jgi:sulfur carrier protein
VRLLKVKLNGAEISLATSLTLEQLLLAKNLELDCVVVEYNEKIVKRNELAAIILKERDEIEVLRFVGGG